MKLGGKTMFFSHPWFQVTLLVALTAVGCGGNGASSSGGSGDDGGPGSGEEDAPSGLDAAGPGRDSGVDASVPGTDSGISSGTDSGTSTGTDSGTGGGIDSGTGTGVDSGTGTGIDSGTGTGTDSGTTVVTGPRTILPFDSGWLFDLGDPAGAATTTFADTSWRGLSVPHDWSIEGANPPSDPFSQTASTIGRGGYVTAGIGWYRKHFTLPQSLSGHQVFVEFDGVMANSDVYINGVHLGNRPYGYVSFRYELTPHVTFGTADNVIAVRCDNSLQPASRFYAGAGIYRHVRVLATAPVHVAQWATYVTTPTATAASATVHVQTSVLNEGTTAQTVSVQGVVSDPGGAALAPVATATQSIAAGATGAFTFDVPVANPKLWDPGSPSMYQLVTNVQIAGSTVDDDVTPFGIRSLTFDGTNGMLLNGKSVKLKGICMHHDVSGLGSAVPMRAWQRRLAQLKALGSNAIRTSHNPVAPEVLDLADRMGFLILDEFFDVWTEHKYADVGDYAADFNDTAAAPIGSPSAGAGATWWETDVTDIVMRDRNHPSVVLYSMGNEIHDSLATRTPIATKMAAICHTLDPSRGVTQALLDPATNGDVTGATRTIVDVWGDNYDVNSVVTATGMAPKRAGMLTEMTHGTGTWNTILQTPAFTGEFLWTGVDYLGEADGLWPTVGSGSGLMDRLGTTKADGYAWQKVWGAAVTTPPTAGTTAAKVTLTADHATLLTDPNDVSYIKATVADTAGHVVTGSAAAVTFAITGPGTLVAVDSGSQTEETFRGNVRKAFQGLCFAIVQATGPGTITVTASSPGLTGSSATVQASAGTFVPCAGTCD
jgi:beta-galactosidase